MLRFAISTLRSRFSLFMGTFLVLTFSMVLLVANGNIIVATLQPAPYDQDIGRYDGAAAIIRADQKLEPLTETDHAPVYLPDTRGIADSTAELVASLDGIGSVVPTRMFTAQVIRGDGNIVESKNVSLGHGWSTTLLGTWRVIEGSPPAHGEEVALNQDLANNAGISLGDAIAVVTPETVVNAQVSAILATEGGGGVTGEDSIFFTDDAAVVLSGQPHLANVIGVTAAPGANHEQLATALSETMLANNTPAVVHTGVDKGGYVAHQVYQEAMDDVLAMMAVIAGIASFICIFVVASTSTLSITQRLREIALLRLIGSTPRQIRRMLVVEAICIALVASVVGSVLGFFVGWWFADMLVAFEIAPAGFSAPFSVAVVPIAAAILSFVAVTGVYVSARRASKIRAIEALRDASASQRVMTPLRWVFGLSFLLLSGLFLVLVPRVHTEGAIVLSFLIAPVLIVALALLSPTFIKPCITLVSALIVKCVPVTGMLARANLQTALRRTTSTAAPILVTVAVVVSVVSIPSMMEATSKADVSKRVVADLVVQPTAQGMPLDTGAALAEVSGIDAVTGFVETQVYDAHELASGPIRAGLVQPTGLHTVLDIDVRQGSLGDFAGGTALISQEIADMRNWRVGQTAPMYLEDGSMHEIRIVAMASTTVGLPDVLLPFDYGLPHLPDPSVQAYYIKVGDSGDKGPLLSAIQNIAKTSGGAAHTPAESMEEQAAQSETAGIVVTALLFGLILVFTVIAIGNTTMMAISNRGLDVRVLYRLGMRKAQIVAMLAVETLIILLVAVAIALVAVAPGIIGTYYTLQRMYDEVVVALPWALFISLICVYALASIAASVASGNRIIRRM